jgi:hypothetical protein
LKLTSYQRRYDDRFPRTNDKPQACTYKSCLSRAKPASNEQATKRTSGLLQRLLDLCCWGLGDVCVHAQCAREHDPWMQKSERARKRRVRWALWGEQHEEHMNESSLSRWQQKVVGVVVAVNEATPPRATITHQSPTTHHPRPPSSGRSGQRVVQTGEVVHDGVGRAGSDTPTPTDDHHSRWGTAHRLITSVAGLSIQQGGGGGQEQVVRVRIGAGTSKRCS